MRRSASSKLRTVFHPLMYLVYFFIPHSRLKFTREGVWFFFLTLAVGIAALNTGIGLLYLMLAMMLSLIIVSGILSELSLMMLSVERVAPEEIFAGRTFALTFHLRNRKRLFPSFSLNLMDRNRAWEEGLQPRGYVLKIPAGQRATVRCQGMIPRRGSHELSKVVLRTEYPFGLFIKEADYRCRQELIVYPALGSIKDRSLLEIPQGNSLTYRRDITGQERDEFHGLREYRVGDNPRWIHWRSSARMEKLMIKEFDALTGEEAVVFLDIAAPAADGQPADDNVELAVSFTATLVSELYRKGYLVTLICDGAAPRAQSSYRGGEGPARMYRALALAGSPGGGQGAITDEMLKSRPEKGLRVLVSADGDRRSQSLEAMEGLKVIRVSHPSFQALFSPPGLEGDPG